MRHRAPLPPLANVLLALGSVLATLIGLEIGLRIATHDNELLGTRLVGSGVIDLARIRADSSSLRAMYDPELGWVARGDDELGRPSLSQPRIRTRGVRIYEPEVPPGVLRACAFGESFTRGDGVLAPESWPAQVEEQSGGRVEAPNFGVGGYGFDQAYLSFLRYAALYRPDVVLAGLNLHAVERTTNLYHPFYNNGPGTGLVKPRFVAEGDSLRRVMRIIPDPIAFTWEIPGFARSPLCPYEGYYDPAIFESSWIDRSRCALFIRSRLAWHDRGDRFGLWRIMGRDSEETEITRRLILRMKTESEAMGARFVAVILPTRRTLRLLMEEKEDIWAPLCDQMEAAGVEIWNLEAPFAAEGNTAEDDARRFLPDGHLTPGTNARVAAAVLEHLGFEKGALAGAR